MHLFFDTSTEFLQDCARLLRAANYAGTGCNDWLATCESEAGLDQYSQRWLANLHDWTESHQVDAALAGDEAAIVQTGLAHHALLADVALALHEGLHGAALLARLQKHFPGVSLAEALEQVRTAQTAYKEYQDVSWQRMMRNFKREGNAGDNHGQEEPTPVAEPVSAIEPNAPPAERAAALLYQLRDALNNEKPCDNLLMAWSLSKQPGAFAKFLCEFCDFEMPDNFPELILRQHAVADQALATKLQLLRITLRGIVARKLRNARTHLASCFDGELPDSGITRFLKDLPDCSQITALLLTGYSVEGWQLSCCGEIFTFDDKAIDQIAATLEHMLTREISPNADKIAAHFSATVAKLVEMEDRAYQCLLREMQSDDLELMLTDLAEPQFTPWGDEIIPPLYQLTAHNMSEVAWLMLADEVARAGYAPLDTFEMTWSLSMLATILQNRSGVSEKTILKSWQKALKHTASYPFKLPDLEIAPDIQWIERKPLQLTLRIASQQFRIRLDNLRLLACQLRYRSTLQQSGTAAFQREWAEAWLEQIFAQHPTRQRRFLRPFRYETVQRMLHPELRADHWPELAAAIVAHPMFTSRKEC